MAGKTLLMQLACLLAIAAIALAEEPEKLVSGKNAANAEFPYMVSIRRNGRHHCGGAIISSKVILTAAHCVVDFAKSDNNDVVTVVAGSNSLTWGGQSYSASKFLYNQNYQPTGNAWDYDVGAIILSSPITFSSSVKPISITTQAPSLDSQATVSAWGATGWPPRGVSASLQKLSLSIIPSNECDRYHYSKISYIHICTYIAPGVGTCSGDSGSPLVQNGKLIGVVSGGIPCATGVPDIFTNLYYMKDFTDKALSYQ